MENVLGRAQGMTIVYIMTVVALNANACVLKYILVHSFLMSARNQILIITVANNLLLNNIFLLMYLKVFQMTYVQL